jgi:hypothetical protein
MAANEGVIADTSGGAFTVTLPASPAVGDTVVITDGADWATTNLTVGRNGSTIEGDAADMTMDIGGVAVQFTFDGTTWQTYAQIGAVAGLGTTRVNFVATAGQTDFSVTYSAGFIDVYLNGIKLIAGSDFTATNGTTVVLTVGAAVGDTVDTVAYNTFSVADTYTVAGADSTFVNVTGDTMTGDLNVTGTVTATSLVVNGNNYPSAGSLGNRNILINGNLNVNQRSLSIASVATGAYGEDRWKKTAGGMTQIVEEVNYLSSTVYTLSGTGVTTQQITSPASGNWTLPDIPVTARLIQLEVGSTATPFEHRSYGQELSLCQRYYETGGGYGVSYNSSAAALQRGQVYYKVTKRAAATNVLTKITGAGTSPGLTYYHNALNDGFVFGFNSSAASQEIVITYTADAEL